MCSRIVTHASRFTTAASPRHRHQMSRLAAYVLAGAMTLGGTAQAQQPRRPLGPPPGGSPAGAMIARPGLGPGGPGGGIASMLLAHTGEFKLTDAQVTRLAGIARRTSDRHRAMRASMDSLRTSTNATMPAAKIVLALSKELVMIFSLGLNDLD